MDKIVYSLLMLILAIPYTWARETRALGIFIRFKTPLTSTQMKELDGLYQKHGLKLKKRLDHYDILEKKNASELELQKICQDQLKHSLIQKCLMDREATLDEGKASSINFYAEEICHADGTASKTLGPLASFVENQKNCQIIPELAGYKTTSNTETDDGKEATPAENYFGHKLSPLWAQEYIGADLAKELIKQNKDSVFSPHIVVLDRGFAAEELEDYTIRSDEWNDFGKTNHHAVKVMKLIVSSYPTSVSENGRIRYVHTINKDSDYQVAEEAIRKKFIKPKIINVSMGGWGTNPDTCESLKKINEKNNTISIVSAGNDFPTPMDVAKRCTSIISVGSLSPLGLSSYFSSEDETITVSAPSDNFLTSMSTKMEKYTAFGGTSGASPLGSGTIANTVAFLPNLTLEQAKTMLTRTALPTLNSFEYPQKNGAGMVNAYKMAYLAKEIRDRCKNHKDQNACEDHLINDPKTYEIKTSAADKKKLYVDMQMAYPVCMPDSIQTQFLTCEDRTKIFNEVRKAALLDPSQKDLWDWLSCVYNKQGYGVNAQFYWLLAHPENAVYLNRQKKEDQIIPTTLAYELKFLTEEKPFAPSIHIDLALKIKKTITINSDEAISQLKKALKDNGPKKRAASLLIIAQLLNDKREVTKDFLEDAQEDKNPQVRELAAYLAVLYFSDQEALPFLKRMVQDESITTLKYEQVLEKSVYRLLNADEKVALYDKVMNGKNRSEQELYALEAARALKKDSIPLLKKLGYSHREATLSAAMDLLPTPDAVDFLILSNKDRNAKRLEFSKSLVQEVFLIKLIQHYQKNKDEREIITELVKGLTPESQEKFKKSIQQK